MTGATPQIDIAPLFGPEAAARRETDAAVMAAAHAIGFLSVVGLPGDVPIGRASRRDLLRVFALPRAAQRALWKKASAPENGNVYRGFFPIEAGLFKEGIDIGPERGTGDPGDALAEPTPLPAEADLPGWRAHVRRVYTALEGVGHVLMRSLARGLALDGRFFDPLFEGGNSTLRLIAYPPWPRLAAPRGWPIRPLEGPGGVRRYDIGGEHVDSGFVTLLQQDDVGGLQARARDGSWIDVPPRDDALVVNFGKLLERWTGGRIRATEHRVLGNDRERCSIPFFYEPRIDARIAPLPIEGGEAFEPFAYGDHLWESMSGFVEFRDAERWATAPPSPERTERAGRDLQGPARND